MGRARLRGYRHPRDPGRSRRSPAQWRRQRKLECEPNDPRTGAHRGFLCQPGPLELRLAGKHHFAESERLDHRLGRWQSDPDCQRLSYPLFLADFEP